MHKHSELIHQKNKLINDVSTHLHYYNVNKFIVYISLELYNVINSSPYKIFKVYLSVMHVNFEVINDPKILNGNYYVIHVDESDKFINDFNDIFI